MDNIKNIIESLLFVADEPLSIERLKKIIVPAEAQEIFKDKTTGQPGVIKEGGIKLYKQHEPLQK